MLQQSEKKQLEHKHFQPLCSLQKDSKHGFSDKAKNPERRTDKKCGSTAARDTCNHKVAENVFRHGMSSTHQRELAPCRSDFTMTLPKLLTFLTVGATGKIFFQLSDPADISRLFLHDFQDIKWVVLQ